MMRREDYQTEEIRTSARRVLSWLKVHATTMQVPTSTVLPFGEEPFLAALADWLHERHDFRAYRTTGGPAAFKELTSACDDFLGWIAGDID